MIQENSNIRLFPLMIFKKLTLILLFCFLGLSCSSLRVFSPFFYKNYDPSLSLRKPSSFESLDLESLDSTKPTVCSITLNSKDEREVFKKHLGKSFNFVELVNPNDEEWLRKSCDSQIRCDILVVSGHFGGSFFGSSGRLSMETLENSSCQSSCQNIFESAKEVFLFGCNTMAGKEPDFRTMQEYADMLYEDHRDVYRTRLMAEESAAYRYSPLGTQTQDRMKRVFKNARIYGFHSTAPSGKNISPRLHKYFKSIPQGDYKAHINKFPTEEENAFWSQAMKGQYIRSTNGAKNSENPICILSSSQPIYQKLSWINSVFTSENVLSYAPNINEYLTSLEKRFGPLKDWWDKWPRNEVSFIEHLKFHKRAKAKVGSFLEKPIEGLLAVQFNLLGLGLKLGWYDSSEKKVIQRRLLGDLFSTNLTLGEKDFVCSLGNVQIDLELEDLPQDKWNRYTIGALGCVRPSSEEVHMALAQALTDPDYSVRRSAVRALGNIKPVNEEIHMALAQALTDPEKYVREDAAWVLGLIKPQSSKVLLFITELLKHDENYVRRSAARALGNIKPVNEEIHMALAQALTDPDYYVRRSAVRALENIKPQSSKVLLFITELLKHDERYVRRSAAWALGNIKPQTSSEEVHMALAQALTDPEKSVREDAAWALRNIKPQSSKVLLFITELLKHDERYVRRSAAWVLGVIKPVHEEIHMALAQALTDPDWGVRANAKWALGEIKPQSLEVREVIKLHNLELYQRILTNER